MQTYKKMSLTIILSGTFSIFVERISKQTLPNNQKLPHMKRYFFILLTALIASAPLFAQDNLESPKQFRRENSKAQWSKITRETMPVPYFVGKPAATLEGFGFMESLDDKSLWEMDERIISAFLSAEVPSAMRQLRKVRYRTSVCDTVEILKKPHVVEIWILPEYLSVGKDEDCVRMPMGPIGAQVIADSLNCCLPTTYLVDRIFDAAEGRLDIFPFRPHGSRNQTALVYHDSNNAIKALYKAYGFHYGQLISGLKKDIVLTCYVERNPAYSRNVAIYGWQFPDGTLEQPLFIRHGNFYADYSHGVRLVWHTVTIDGKEYELRDVMRDEKMYRLVSDEPMPLKYASYSYQEKWK